MTRSRENGPLIGAHMSVAGGLHNAVLEAARHRCRAVQIFTRNNNRWDAKPLSGEEISAWKEALAAHPMDTMVHDSYLINLASPDPKLWERSRRAFLEEAERCIALGIERLVFHPGSHVGTGEAAGLDRVARALDWVERRLEGRRLRLLVENTAGQGTNLGASLEHLAALRDRVQNPDRLAYCIDTCHLLAAGYEFRTDEGYEAVFADVERLLGRDRVLAFHLNDSVRDLGSRVDRHAHIGKGCIGSRPFRRLLADGRFRDAPKVLETPKAGGMDARNLALLRRLASMGWG